MAKLGLNGDALRGNDVIKILEMLGGENKYLAEGFNDNAFYFISDKMIIDSNYHCIVDDSEYTILSISEFEEKFPFKIGDSVSYHTLGEICSVGEIIHMDWNDVDNIVLYVTTNGHVLPANALKFVYPESDEVLLDVTEEDANYIRGLFNKHKNYNDYQYSEEYHETTETTECNDIEDFVADVIDFTNNIVYDDKVKLELGSTHEVVVDNDGNTYVVKKKTKKESEISFPKTYLDCCNTVHYTHYYPDIKTHTIKYDDMLGSLYKLIICRDVYWFMSDDWKPDYTNVTEKKYSIWVDCGEIKKGVFTTTQMVLAFPTEEIRDEFYENFKDLIEECKELL